MAGPTTNQGVYDVVEASALLGISVERLVSWANPTVGGLEAIVRPTFDRAFSFIDLVSLRVAVELAGNGVTDRDLRTGIAQLRHHFETPRPLAQAPVIEALATSGSSFLADLGEGYLDIGKGRQGVFQDVARLYLRHIQFGSDGQPNRWAPSDDVLLDPLIQAGAPCVTGTRIPTTTISESLLDDTVEDVAHEFHLTIAQVRNAATFQQRLDAGYSLAA